MFLGYGVVYTEGVQHTGFLTFMEAFKYFTVVCMSINKLQCSQYQWVEWGTIRIVCSFALIGAVSTLLVVCLWTIVTLFHDVYLYN